MERNTADGLVPKEATGGHLFSNLRNDNSVLNDIMRPHAKLTSPLWEAAESPHAVIIRLGDSLHCFENSGEDCLEPMTLQVGFAEQPMLFEAVASTFAKRCLPAILSKLGFIKKVRLAFVDTDLEWRHDDVLREWVEIQNRSDHVVGASTVEIQTYLAEVGEPPIPYTYAVWGASNGLSVSQNKEGARLTQSIAAMALGQKRLRAAHTQVREPVVLTEKQNAILINTLSDVPAAFDQIVWSAMSDYPHHHKRENCSWLSLLRLGPSLTTWEMAAKLQATVSIEALIAVFSELRQERGLSVTIPMIGYNPKWLFTKSRLVEIHNAANVYVTSEELKAFRFLRIANLPNRRKEESRIAASIRRCIGASSQGLFLYDLTEDVVCDLTGNAHARISSADALCVYAGLKQMDDNGASDS